MKSFKGVMFAVVAIALAAAVQAGAGGRTTVSVSYTVGGLAVPGVSGLMLQPGDVVSVNATGAVCPFGDSYCPGPDGTTAVDTTSSAFGGFPLPGAPAWGLVGRVGSGPWVQIGRGPTTLTGAGALAFAVNDDLLVDNAGSFTVTVSYACWPGWGYGDKNHTHCGPPGLVAKAQAPVPENGNRNGNGSTNGHENGNGNANGNSSADPGPQAGESQGHGQPGNGKGKG